MLGAMSPMMKQLGTYGVIGLAAANLVVGCVPTYKPPTANEPHAILKLRRTYEKNAGTQLSEVVMIGDSAAYRSVTDSRTAATPRNDAILVHPVPADLAFQTQFSHQYTHMVQEQYNEQVPYQTTEMYNCGTPPHYQSCSRSVTQYRSEAKTRWVNRTDTVVDGRCDVTLRLNPKQGSSYLMQYTYQDNRLCSLSCFEQTTLTDGSLQQNPCAP